jgi:hypothetical protein
MGVARGLGGIASSAVGVLECVIRVAGLREYSLRRVHRIGRWSTGEVSWETATVGSEEESLKIPHISKVDHQMGVFCETEARVP